MVDEETVKKILKTYEEAWTEQDINKILSIFHEDGTYQERLFKDPLNGHKEIGEYWKTKVIEEQSDIKFKLIDYYICGDTAIAEWDASFYSDIKNRKIHIKEVAIMQILDGKIKSLKEYWQSEK